MTSSFNEINVIADAITINAYVTNILTMTFCGIISKFSQKHLTSYMSKRKFVALIR